MDQEKDVKSAIDALEIFSEELLGESDIYKRILLEVFFEELLKETHGE